MIYRVGVQKGADGRSWADYETLNEAVEIAMSQEKMGCTAWVVDLRTQLVIYGEAPEE